MNTVYNDPHLMAATQIAAAELFEHDNGMIPWGCLTVEAEAFGCQIEMLEDYYPRVVERPLAADPNLARLCDPDPSSSGRMPLVIEALTELRQRSGEDLFIIAMVVSPFLVAAELRGMTEFLMDFISDPPFVEALSEYVTEGTQRYLEAILRTRACDAVMFENAGACRELMGPHDLARYVMPYHQRLLETARREAPEVFLIEHNCSNTPYFEEILALDVDGVNFAYGDVRAIYTKYGWNCHATHTSTNTCLNRFCLHPRQNARPVAWIGNVDHSQVLLRASPEEVFREARACIESARSGPFVLSTGCEIPFNAPVENIRALARAAHAGQ
jgi:uroporphyrinogen decarboxylase